jgi:transketolase
MRKQFAELLYEKMRADDRIVVVTGDLGFGLFDKIRTDFKDRFFNAGAAEQAAMGIAVGLALEAKIPVMYSITPFLLWRAAETIRNYIDHEKIPVKLVGSGRDDDYSHDGFSHYAGDDFDMLKNFKNIICYWPDGKEDLPDLVNNVFSVDKPFYLNLKR